MANLKVGSRGENVKLLQELLNAKGFDCGNADGIFGAKTKAAVKAFQIANSLTADGIAGKYTMAALNGEPIEDVVLSAEDLKQFSSPHGSMPYGPDKTWSTYKSGGCGVTSFAIVQRAYELVPAGEKATDTIQRLGKYAWEHGYRIKGGGTSSNLFKTNGTTFKTTTKQSEIEDAIRSGHLVILHIRKGFPNGYQGEGHYIVAYGIKDDRLLLRDVGSSASGRQSCPLSKCSTGLKGKGAYIIMAKG